MKEIQDILAAYQKSKSEGQKAALATVVKVEGSSYRQPGARMLITEDGRLTGAISGGCLEGDALRKALLVMARGTPQLVTYDTSEEDSDILGVGLGCNGIVHILIEPIHADDPQNPLYLIQNVLQDRVTGVWITLFSAENRETSLAGSRYVFAQSGVLSELVSDPILDAFMHTAARDALQLKTSLIRTFSSPAGDLSLLAQLIKPAISLVIAGAGNDTIPLVKMADLLGWHTTILDGRPSHATCARFPGAGRILVSDAENALAQIVPDDNTAFLLMTHNYQYDLALLQKLITLPVAYIGVLGPKSKLTRLLGDLKTSENPDPVIPECLYGPIGLDIGAETSAEISLSILAEIQAVFTGKKGESLRTKTGAIHNTLPEETVKSTKTGIRLTSDAAS